MEEEKEEEEEQEEEEMGSKLSTVRFQTFIFKKYWNSDICS